MFNSDTSNNETYSIAKYWPSGLVDFVRVSYEADHTIIRSPKDDSDYAIVDIKNGYKAFIFPLGGDYLQITSDLVVPEARSMMEEHDDSFTMYSSGE